MFRTSAAFVALLATAAPAQVASLETSRPAPVTGDAHKIVCQKTETLGTRLGARKVCLTVKEWEDRLKADRDTTENVQRLSDFRRSD